MARTPLNALLLSVFLAIPTLAGAQNAAPSDATSATTQELQILPADGFDLDTYLWENRVLAVFADTPADTRFIKQLDMLNEWPRDLIERDVIVVIDSDPAARSDIRQRLRPRGFALVLVDKDGLVKLRKPSPWSTREIGRSIDKTPVRRQEIRERNTGPR